MKILVLGSGTSTGVPEIGCSCHVCRSKDPRDKRSRLSLLLSNDEGKRLLFDCSPDFREQAIKAGIDSLDAIILSHEHNDHVGGLEDLRTITWHSELPIYAERRVVDSIQNRLHYIFQQKPYPGIPKLSLQAIRAFETYQIAGFEVEPIRVMHGRLPIMGYRIGDMAIITDMKEIEPSELEKLYGIRLLFVNALRYAKPHPSHQTIEDALALVEKLGCPETYLIHLSHHAPLQERLDLMLPAHVHAAYDGLELDLRADSISACTYNPATPRAEYSYSDCGRIDYEKALHMQRSYFDEAIALKQMGQVPQNRLLFCEHNPVLTIGKHGADSNLLVSQELLREKGIELYHVERGGDITYHGPGQITGYPLFDLEQFGIGLRQYIELMEQCIIDFLALYGIRGERSAGASGVWIEPDKPGRARKICAIGVRSSRHYTMHGFALNIDPDLSYFKLINPCGFADKGVSSLALETGAVQYFELAKQQLESIFYERFVERRG